MLDMNLIQEKPAPQYAFRHSLADDVFSTLSLVLEAPALEGLDQWAYATHAALPPTLRRDVEIAMVLLSKSRCYTHWVYDLPADAAAHEDFDAMLAWLESIPPEQFAAAVQETLAKMSEHCEEMALPSGDALDVLRACLIPKFEEEQVERAVQLFQDPVAFKALFISVITRFWEQFYQKEYEQCLPLVRRSLEHHRHQNYSGDLVTVFVAVTGRRFPRDFEAKGGAPHEDATRVVFLPSCHIGPFVMIAATGDGDGRLMIHYNCRPTGTPEREAEAPAIQGLFPPLKALADETRLQILALLDGKELYAQEIVDQLDISQSAVSRHLHLMVAGGILDARKQESMKYYSINQETLAALAEGLRRFKTYRG